MQSYLLQGENHPESRKKLLELIREAKTAAREIVRVDGLKLRGLKPSDSSSVTPSELKSAVADTSLHPRSNRGFREGGLKGEKVDLNLLSRSQSLIGTGILFVLEDYFSSNRTLGLLGAGKKPLQTIKPLFEKQDASVSFVFWESKTIPFQTAKALEKYLTVIEYKIPKTLFNFLNSISAGNTKNTLKLLQNAKHENSPDMLLIMLSRQVRLLYCVLVDSKNLKLPDWQKRSLEQQAKKFTPEQLLKLHQELLELDRKNKRSQLPEDLGASLDLLVASL